MNLTKFVSTVIVLTSLFYQSISHAENYQAKIVKVQGQVYVLNEQGEKRVVDTPFYRVKGNETVVTSKSSKAVLQFENGSMSVLGQKSSLRVEKSGWLSQLGGKVFYVFKKVFGKQKSRQVKTKFATIGIRGTSFIVDAENDSQQIALQEGNLNIESPGDDYAIYKPAKVMDDFAAFKQQEVQRQQALKDEFTDYKKNIKKEFVEYKKSFDLKANRVVSFNGNRVDESDLDKNWQTDFNDFESFSKDYIEAYKELDNM